MYLDGLMAFSALKSVPKTEKDEKTKNGEVEKVENPIIIKYTNPLTLNMCMCQLEMGFPKKSLSIVDSLIA